MQSLANHVLLHRTPVNSYSCSSFLVALVGIFFAVQILTGIFLVMRDTALTSLIVILFLNVFFLGIILVAIFNRGAFNVWEFLLIEIYDLVKRISHMVFTRNQYLVFLFWASRDPNAVWYTWGAFIIFYVILLSLYNILLKRCVHWNAPLSIEAICCFIVINLFSTLVLIFVFHVLGPKYTLIQFLTYPPTGGLIVSVLVFIFQWICILLFHILIYIPYPKKWHLWRYFIDAIRDIGFVESYDDPYDKYDRAKTAYDDAKRASDKAKKEDQTKTQKNHVDENQSDQKNKNKNDDTLKKN